MVRCLELAARPGIHRVRICIYLSATRQVGLSIRMAGGAVAQTHGRSAKENPCGSRFHHLYLRTFIHPVLRLLIRRTRQQELLWTTARRVLMRLLMNVGTISPPEARKAESCDPRDRAPLRRLVPRNGFSRRVRTMAFIRSMSASPRSGRRLKARSIPSVMRVKAIR